MTPSDVDALEGVFLAVEAALDGFVLKAGALTVDAEPVDCSA